MCWWRYCIHMPNIFILVNAINRTRQDIQQHEMESWTYNKVIFILVNAINRTRQDIQQHDMESWTYNKVIFYQISATMLKIHFLQFLLKFLKDNRNFYLF